MSQFRLKSALFTKSMPAFPVVIFPSVDAQGQHGMAVKPQGKGTGTLKVKKDECSKDTACRRLSLCCAIKTLLLPYLHFSYNFSNQ